MSERLSKRQSAYNFDNVNSFLAEINTKFTKELILDEQRRQVLEMRDLGLIDLFKRGALLQRRIHRDVCVYITVPTDREQVVKIGMYWNIKRHGRRVDVNDVTCEYRNQSEKGGENYVKFTQGQPFRRSPMDYELGVIGVKDNNFKDKADQLLTIGMSKKLGVDAFEYKRIILPRRLRGHNDYKKMMQLEPKAQLFPKNETLF